MPETDDDQQEEPVLAPQSPRQDAVAAEGLNVTGHVVPADESHVEPLLQEQQEDIPVEKVDGEFVLWRVFGLSDVFEDRPSPAWDIEDSRGPGPNDRLRVSIGDFPADLRNALIQWRAQVPSILNSHVGHEQTYGEIEEAYERGLTDEAPAPLLDPYPLWFTLRLSRPTRPTVVGGGLLPLWFKDGFQATAEEARTFEAKGNRYLDGVLALMVGSLPPMNVGALRYPGREAWLLVQDRPAWRVPKPRLTIKDSGVHVGRTAGWAATVPVDELQAALTGLPGAGESGTLGRRTSKAAAFFASARAVAEDDDLGRFVYSFAGLELLATQVEGNSRERLVERLRDLGENLPFRELLWPAKGDDWAERNLLFRFSAMAALYAPSTAVVDTALCKQIARTRNSLFHGNESASDLRNHGVACTELLRRYLGLVAREEAGLGT